MPHPNEAGTAARNTDFSLWAAFSTSFAFSNLAHTQNLQHLADKQGGRAAAAPPSHPRPEEARAQREPVPSSASSKPARVTPATSTPAAPQKRGYKSQPGSRGQPAPCAYSQRRSLRDPPGTSGQKHGYSTGTHPKPREHSAWLGTRSRVTLWYIAGTPSSWSRCSARCAGCPRQALMRELAGTTQQLSTKAALGQKDTKAREACKSVLFSQGDVTDPGTFS